MKPHGCGVQDCYGRDSIFHNPARGGPPFDPFAGKAVIRNDSKWIEFALTDPLCRDEKKKTFTWTVRTKGGERSLGRIKWQTGWRTYAFFPESDPLFEPTCLRDLAAFIDARMDDRKDP